METNHTEVTLNKKAPLISNWQPINNTLPVQSDEIGEIISKEPPFFVRWGTVLFFLLLFVISLICWFIQYPEIVLATARLHSINAPKEVLTRTDGKLSKVLVKNNDKVEAGTTIGFMESLANPNAVAAVSKQIDSIHLLISQHQTDGIVDFFPDYAHQKFLNELGELQASYQLFIQSFVTFKDFISNGFYLRKKTMLLTDVQNIQRLHIILIEQKDLLQQDLSLSHETFTANESLAKDKVLSPLDYRNERSKLIAKQLSLPQINASIISNESQENEKRKEIAELENQIVVQKNSFNQALLTFKSQVQAWEYKYLLKAPVSGRVTQAGFFQENQEMKAGKLLFYVQPESTSYFVEMLVPQYNFGKVKAGQQVLLKFQAYPFEQYGSVIGKIEYINPTPSDSGFLAKVHLPDGLTTNYREVLQYRNGLFAQAEIVTENMRLLERFYYNVAKQISR